MYMGAGSVIRFLAGPLFFFLQSNRSIWFTPRTIFLLKSKGGKENLIYSPSARRAATGGIKQSYFVILFKAKQR